MPAKRVLVVEDDVDSASVLEAYLIRDGFQVIVAANGKTAVEMYAQWKPHLVLLDVMLPGLSGIDVLGEIRRTSDTAVIMLTAVGDEPDKIGALRYGADDYVVKPCSPKEVVARVHAVLRRSTSRFVTPKQLRYESLCVDLEAFVARVDDNQLGSILLDLTPAEFNLLASLLRTPFKAFTRAELLEACQPGSNALERVIDTHIHNLRRKLEKCGISGVLVTVRAVGYRFS